ncbi:MAG TPA: nucleotidyltransferase domain-containing protein [Streptosporangiaceae bacterium]|nr:nucleotidyltransferase domain-containing protein [Streptosporangiaceae bacterium]
MTATGAPAHGKHATPEFRAIADAGTILRCQVGSGVHGTAISGYDDRDEMGICIEPPTYAIGVRSFPPHTSANPGDLFEQYEHHTAWDRPGGLANRSGHGDLDAVVYSLRKWARLALAGNPSVLLPLFVPESEVTVITPAGRELRAMAPAIVSRQAGESFIGYLSKQRANMLSRDGKGNDVTRPELVERYGWDVKFGGHMVRLGFQGVELLTTGRITLPMPVASREVVRDIRMGRIPMDRALALAGYLEDRIGDLLAESPLREYPDRDLVDEWLVSTYLRAWSR